VCVRVLDAILTLSRRKNRQNCVAAISCEKLSSTCCRSSETTTKRLQISLHICQTVTTVLRLKLHYFVLLRIRRTTSRTTTCTASRHVGMLWNCWRPSILCGLVLYNLWTCRRLSVCCGFVVQLVVQQIHNQVEFGCIWVRRSLSTITAH